MAASRWWRPDRWRWDDPAPETLRWPDAGRAVEDGSPAGDEDGGGPEEAAPDNILAAFLPGGPTARAEVIDLAARRAERARGPARATVAGHPAHSRAGASF